MNSVAIEAYNKYMQVVRSRKEVAEIYTSYFANLRNIQTDEYLLLSIANSMPKDLVNDIVVLRELVPRWSIVSDYKAGLITEDKYNERYFAQLADVDKDVLLRKIYGLCGKSNKTKALLLCWEGKGKFCHRHSAVRWLGVGTEL